MQAKWASLPSVHSENVEFRFLVHSLKIPQGKPRYTVFLETLYGFLLKY